MTKQELIDTLYDFLLALIPLKASAVLIIDEAQNLPLPVLEQIRILSNLETDKEKLLQIILVGQLNLKTLLRSPELRQLDQRVSIRYELEPLDRETVGAYVAHRLTIAGGSQAVTFTPKALERRAPSAGGIPRLINLICDRALLAGFSVRANRITPDMVAHAADSLELPQPRRCRGSNGLKRSASLFAAAAVVLARIRLWRPVRRRICISDSPRARRLRAHTRRPSRPSRRPAIRGVELNPSASTVRTLAREC